MWYKETLTMTNFWMVGLQIIFLTFSHLEIQIKVEARFIAFMLEILEVVRWKR